MQLIKIDLINPDKSAIAKAVNVLKKNGLIIYPTDTAYCLGGNALNSEIVKKIYSIKGRDLSKPTHVIVRDWKMIEKFCHIIPAAKRLFNIFMPGPLTIVLKKKNIVPNILTANFPTLGVRLPDCKVTQMISQSVKFPYTTPSANRSGGKTPFSVEEVKKELNLEKVDLVLDAGELPKVPPSTIIDLTTNVPRILRKGPISKHQINRLLHPTTNTQL